MYNHGFACLALAELMMLNDDRIGLSLKKAVSLIVAAAKSNPKNAWRYYPDSKDFDTTVSGTQIVALFAARNAGLSVPNETIEKALEVMISCQDSRGGFGYSTSSGANLPRTSIGSLVLSLAQKTDTESYSKSLEYLQRNAKYGDQGHKFYSLYYTAQAMFRLTRRCGPNGTRGMSKSCLKPSRRRFLEAITERFSQLVQPFFQWP